MSESNGDKLDWLFFAQRHGALLNEKGGYYRRGKQYGMEKKLTVADTYLHYQLLDVGRPSILNIASEHKISWKFVRKVESELYMNDGCVVSPEEITLDMVSRRRMGPGSIILDQLDCFALYCLYHKKPTRSLRSYVYDLYRIRGTIVSGSVVMPSKFAADFACPILFPMTSSGLAMLRKLLSTLRRWPGLILAG
jgi:hypothetical protein